MNISSMSFVSAENVTSQSAIEYFEGCEDRSKIDPKYRFYFMKVVFRIEQLIKDFQEFSPMAILGDHLKLTAELDDGNLIPEGVDIDKPSIISRIYKITIRMIFHNRRGVHQFRVEFHCKPTSRNAAAFYYDNLSAEEAAVYCNHLLLKGYLPLNFNNQLINIRPPFRQKSAMK